VREERAYPEERSGPAAIDGTHSHSGTTASSGSGGAHNNVQPTIVANYQIYTGVHA
jgi:microcystin-dependent protein